MVRVGSFDSRETAHRRHHAVPLTTATSQTRRPFHLFKPGTKFRIHSLQGYCRTEAGAVTADALIVDDNDIVQAGAVTVHATPEQLAIAAGRYVVNGTVVEKAAATGITFTAAHVVTASKFGIVLLQMSDAGVVSTKTPGATQTTPMAYNSAALALAALPAVDAGKLAIGYIAIENNALDWTANTDDLTNGSDLATAAITTYAATAVSALAGAVAFVGGKTVTQDNHATLANYRDVTGDKGVLLEYTSDGSGALTDGMVTLVWRPIPMYRDPSLGI